MSKPVFLVPEAPSHEILQVLSGLCEHAKSGDLNGIIFGVSFKGQRYYCDAAGTLHRNPVVALGVSTMLSEELQRRMRTASVDTVI
jgi:hypothetical protein